MVEAQKVSTAASEGLGSGRRESIQTVSNNDRLHVLCDIRMTASVKDGAYSWLLCVASFFNVFVIGGFIYASGMFYILFKDSLSVTDSEASLMTSINIGVGVCVCPFVGMSIEYFGNRCIAMIGSVVSTTGLAFSAFSTQVYHMYICYGFIVGIGFGMLHISSIMVLNSYFDKYKRIALSLVLAGFGAGSFIVPPILNFLEDAYGWRGAILLLAGINAHTLVTCSLFRPFGDVPQQVKYPHPQDTVTFQNKEKASLASIQLWLNGNTRAIKEKGLEILSLFKIIPYLCLVVCTVILTFPNSIILTHFGSYLLTLQFTSEDVVNLYITLGISATVARPLVGVVAEITHANTAMFITLTILLSGVLTMFLPFLHQLWMMYVYAAFFQLLQGAYLGLGPAIVMEHVPRARVPTAYGLHIFFSVPGYTLGAPIAAWMYDYTEVYAHPFYLAGALIITSGLTMVPAACYIHKTTPHIQDVLPLTNHN